MRWLPPENKLGPQQREFIKKLDDFLHKPDSALRNVWINGFAGSGKSILLVYSVHKILSFSSNSRILVVVFTHSLVEMFKAALKEIGLNVPVVTYFEFMKDNNHYDYILCDEVQDLTHRVIHAMMVRASHVIVAGDSNQSIFDTDPYWHESTVESSEIGYLINGDAFELGIIYRLSRSIIDAVQRFLPRMNIFSSKRDMSKSDTQIRLCEASSEAEEVSYIIEQATKSVNQGYSTVILIPTHRKIISFINQALIEAGKNPWIEQRNRFSKIDFDAMNKYMQSNGLKMQYVGNGYGHFSDDNRKVIIMTFHSSKGLDFDDVFIPFVNSSMFICSNESLAKTLFMVAMTRTRSNLYITYHGYPSDYLDTFKSNCSRIDISASTKVTTTIDGDNPWGF